MSISRRRLMQTAGVAALAAPAITAAAMPEPKFESKDTPKIGLAIGDGGGLAGAAGRGAADTPAAPGAPPTGEEASARRIRQLGVEWVLSGGPRIPWEADRLKEQMERIKGYGLNLGNLMISGFDNAIYNRPNRDQDIEKVVASIEAAG